VNLLYYPLENLMAGVEVQWIRRINYNDGWATNATRIQLSVRYNFSYALLKKNQ
jgi:hypothetical protein